MDLTYFKRYRMELSLVGQDYASVEPPVGFRFVPWNPSLLDAFAEAKYRSFRGEIDANVFPCLGELAGCRRLMGEIARKPGFIPEATWLVERQAGERRPADRCGTVQGVRDQSGLGASRTWELLPRVATAAWGRRCFSRPWRVSNASACSVCTWK